MLVISSSVHDLQLMVYSGVQGSLPGEWGASGSFPALQQLNVSGTRHLGGPLPAAWGSQPNSMGRLQLLMAGDCNMTGTLPAAWASSLPALRGLDVGNSNLSGGQLCMHAST